jgi:hypothetical protein
MNTYRFTYSLLFLIGSMAQAQQEEPTKKIYSSLLVRDFVQVGSLIIGSDGSVNSLTVTGNEHVNGSVSIDGQLFVDGKQITTTSSSGNVTGPTQSTTHAIAIFTDSSGKVIGQSSAPVTLDTSNNIAGVNNLTVTGNINLPTTSGSGNGVITQNGSSLVHTFTTEPGSVGDLNLFIGTQAGNFTSTQGENVGIGPLTLSSITNATEEVAIGSQALQHDSTGNDNTAIGTQAMQTLVSGNNNVAVGYQALNVLNGNNNNTAIGTQALSNLGSGTMNIGLGYQAGMNLTSGNNNVYIANIGVASESDIIRIGTSGTQTACYISGINGVTSAGGTAVYVNSSGQLGTVPSSRRYKKDIRNMASVTALLSTLRPVTFKYIPERDASGELNYGLIAEEVAERMPDLVIYKDGQPETVKYHMLPAILLKALQELIAQHEDFTKRIERLENR